MDRSAIATAARRMISEIGTTFISTGGVYDAITDAMIDLNADTSYNRADATIGIRTGTRYYALSGTIMEVHRIRLGTGSDRTSLLPKTPAAMDRDDVDWEAGTAGTPTQYMFDGRYLWLDPRPPARTAWAAATTYATGAIRVPTTTKENGFTYKVQTGGVSHASTEPTWPTTLDGTVSDNTITWKQDGHTRLYLWSTQSPAALSAAGSVPTWCPNRFHRTIAKKTAINIAKGLAAEQAGSGKRLQVLYNEYLDEARELRNMVRKRSSEVRQTVALGGGYDTFRR